MFIWLIYTANVKSEISEPVMKKISNRAYTTAQCALVKRCQYNKVYEDVNMV